MRPFLAALAIALFASSAFASTSPKKASTADEGCLKTEQAFFAAWNQHDPKMMASFWTDDATLINPMGVEAHGRSEIEKLMTQEQSTMFKGSTANLVGLKVTRSLGPNMVFCDGDVTLDGAVGPDGAAMPQLKVHMAMIMVKHGANWMMTDGRPYAFTPAMPMPPDAGAVKN